MAQYTRGILQTIIPMAAVRKYLLTVVFIQDSSLMVSSMA
jgi:hypothetical protein